MPATGLGRKLAVIVNASTTPLKWQLLDAQGQVLLSGDTIVVGPDANWFFKCTGPKKTMLSHKSNFDGIVNSVQFK